MSGEVSARPANLRIYVEQAAEIRSQLSERITELTESYDQFQQGGYEYGAANASLTTNGLPGMLSRYQTNETFVDVVREAFVNAEVQLDGGVAKVDSATLDAAYTSAARGRGLDPNALAGVGQPISVDDPVAWGQPPTSGFVNDPVSAATGHFLEVEDDLVVPLRLGVLGWRRTYTSRSPAAGPHGRGWASWASAMCVRQADGSVAYQGPDGQLAVFLAGRTRVPGLQATLSERRGGGFELRWDWASQYPGQLWAFRPDGLVDTVSGPMLGATAFGYADGRLASLGHDGGRQLDVEWAGSRIVALHCSDGRTVRYRYDDAGDLVGSDKAADPRRYVLDDEGRIVEVWDADEVRLCRNVYDADGRVTRQVSPFGRETIFTYLPGRRTTVSDTANGPVSSFEHDAAGRLTSLTNDLGETYVRTFDDEGRCLGMTDFDGTGTAHHYDEAGNLAAIEGRDGTAECYTHDESGRVTSHQLPGRPPMTFEYARPGDQLPSRIAGADGWEMVIESTAGLAQRLTDADGVTVELSYDSDGSVVSSTNGAGATTRFVPHPTGQVAEVLAADGTRVVCDVNDAGQVQAVRLPSGDVWTIEYSPAGRIAATVDPDGSRSTIEYGTHGAVERLLDALGGVVELRHDHLERLVGMTAADGAKWEYAYSALGMLTMIGDPTGATWLYDHDAEGRLTAATDPLGNRMRQHHDALGRLATVTDRNGQATRFVRDEAGRLIGAVDANGAETSYRYDGWGRPLDVLGADGERLTYTYTPAGRVHAMRSGEGRGFTFRYDEAGRLVEAVNAEGRGHRYEWDRCDRLVAQREPSGRIRRYEYDAIGRRVATVDAGLRWTLAYDQAGRVTATTDPLGAATRYAYDAVGRLVEATDPLGATTRVRYDERGNPVAVIDPFGGAVVAEYDAMRRIVASTDQLGRTTRFGRDATGAVTARELPTGHRVSVERDRCGRVTDLRVDGRDVIVTDRDAVGRPVLVHEPGANRTHHLRWSPGGRLEGLDAGGRRWQWGYDSDGFLTSRTDPAGREVGFERDRIGLVGRVRSDRWGDVEIVRDRDGRVVAVRAAGVEREWRHDPAGRLAGYRETLAGRPTHTELTRDAAGRVVGVATDGATTTFTYDAAGQLVGSHGPQGTSAWHYDAAGRLVSEDTPEGSGRYEYDGAHQLVAMDGPSGATMFEYDALGRRVASAGPSGGRRYHWDALDRLTRVERDGHTERLDIDAFGALVGVGDATLDWDINGAISDLVAIDGDERVAPLGIHLGTASTSGVAWASTDWRGSPVATDPWGAPEAGHQAGDLGIGAFGELAVGGLTWLRNRAYDPTTRSFLSTDPLAGILGQAVASNPYHYGANDPLGAVDPLGLQPVSIEQYKAIKEQVTGPRWANIAMIGLGVASFFIPGGPLVMLAVGAAMGAAPGVINGITTGNWDWKAIAIGGAVGGLAGAAGGAFAGRFASQAVGSFGRQVAVGAGSGFVGSTAAEGIDWMTGGEFNPEAIVAGTVVGGATGPLGFRAGNRPANAPEPPPTPRPGPNTKVVNAPEVTSPHPVKPQDAIDRWNDFLGDGPHTNTHPRTGQPDPDRIVSADGTHSIRYGDHEAGTGQHAGAKPSKHHYHEESWSYDSSTDTMTVTNTKVNVPLPNK